MQPVSRRAALGAAALVPLGACSGDPEPTTAPSPSRTTSAAPSASPTPTADPLPPAPDRVSLPTLMREEFAGGPVRRVRRTVVAESYERFEVTYPAGDATVSGVLYVPRKPGRHPAVVLNHGYIEPSVYVTGQGLLREQEALARAGYVVLHTDYRGHAASSPASDLERETRLAYTRDTLHAVASVKRMRVVDPERVAMLGRSMGGGVTLNALVARPDAVRAGVVYASVSSRFEDNFDRWSRPSRPDAATAFESRFGTPAAAPAFWEGLSARTYFDRIEVPVLSHHGTRDESCPIAWARTTDRLLRRAGVRTTLHVYEGEQHAFVPQWQLSMDRTIGFLRRHLS